jgi:DNA-binding NtrC family response regulator
MMATRASETLPQSNQPCTVLAVNLVAEDSISLAGILCGSCWRLKEVQTCREALSLVRGGALPVVVCEAQMPDGDWNSLVGKLLELSTPPAVIVVSRLADERLWAEVLNLRGYDVLMTPFDRNEVLRVFSSAWIAGNGEAERMPADLKKPPVVASGPQWRCAASAL